MDLQKHLRLLLALLYAALSAAALAFLLPALLPFLLALGLAWALEPAVRLLTEKLRAPRALASAAVVLAFAALLLAGLALLLRRAWYELGGLIGRLPGLLEAVQTLGGWAEGALYRLSVACPAFARDALESALDRALEQAGAFLSGLPAKALGWIASAAGALPAAGLFLLTALLACFFILADRDALAGFLRRRLPARWLSRLTRAAAQIKGALGGWLRAQGILMAATFALLCCGFLLAGVGPALLLAALTAALDALPVLGVGMVLIPWAAAEALCGRLGRAGALLALYAVVWLVRSLLEPRLVAGRAGLHPLCALFAMYAGFSLFGAAGLILAPLAAVVLRQLIPASAGTGRSRDPAPNRGAGGYPRRPRSRNDTANSTARHRVMEAPEEELR